ncbi:MAG: urocanate hydratase [Candidatus Poseidoniaceae archaeon]|jgi:urocanate hydratase|nr:urocanate hydratase [Candidatus Poseidoniaceae archaeon]
MATDIDAMRIHVSDGIPLDLPEHPGICQDVDHAPARRQVLSNSEKKMALRNALRYFPSELHEQLAPEFAEELETYGRIWMMRYRPSEYKIRGYPIDSYPCKSTSAAAIMLMIHNNLDVNVAQFPHELITYGGNGAVFQNWAQYRLVMKYLCEMEDDQTLVIYSGHPLGIFPSNENAPRVVITNGMVIPNYSSQDDYDRMNAMGVSQYGQMTAGSYMYIGPQGIVHGTTITILNAARMHAGATDSLSGVSFVTSGLGGMSGAQAKAAVIAGASCIVSEINPHAAEKRHRQGWVNVIANSTDEAIDLMLDAVNAGEAISIAHVGNIVDLLERIVERNVNVDLLSDQTSLHNPWQGGYYPVTLSFDDSIEMMSSNPTQFKSEVQKSLRRHAEAINKLTGSGTYFWDYGNAFLLEASRAGADVMDDSGTGFRYPSYVEDIMGPMCFDYGFGPFRWVCTSGKPEDLIESDLIAAKILTQMSDNSPEEIKQQMLDNLRWIKDANKNNLVVGTQARILYADAEGRKRIAKAFNDAISDGRISAPIVLGRDHHDVSGTDSPYRETANIQDGSMFTADMSVQNFVGDSFRGATWVSLHNGGGVGWGEVINGGFGLLIDGTMDSEIKLKSMLDWDVNNGITRRAWARNDGALFAIRRAMDSNPKLKVTLPHVSEDKLIDSFFHGGV